MLVYVAEIFANGTKISEMCSLHRPQTQVVAVVCVAGAFLASYSKVPMQFGQSKHSKSAPKNNLKNV